jgi:hypothetical protein
VGDLFLESLRIQDETEQARINLIRTDLELCLTFATVAKTAFSMGHTEHAERAVASAEKGYLDMLGLYSKARKPTPETKKELQLKFTRLRERLDELQRLRP